MQNKYGTYKKYALFKGAYFYVLYKNINLSLAKREKMSKKGKKCFTNEDRFYIIVLEFNARWKIQTQKRKNRKRALLWDREEK